MATTERSRRKSAPVVPAVFSLRMKELSARTGLPRQVLHFYIQQGLLPEGYKPGRNMAWYSEAHVDRVRLIRRLQEDGFLPLKAIRALIEERDDAFTPRQRLLISELRTREEPGSASDAATLVRAQMLCKRTGVSRAELRKLEALGFLTLRKNGAGRTAVAKADVYVVELWGELKRAGFDRAHGFRVEDLAVYKAAVSSLLSREARLFGQRLAGKRAGPAARMLERVMPLLDILLTRYHAAQVRRLLSSR